MTKRCKKMVEVGREILGGKNKDDHIVLHNKITELELHRDQLRETLANVTANRDSIQRDFDWALSVKESVNREIRRQSILNKISDWCLVVIQISVSLMAVTGLIIALCYLVAKAVHG